MGLPHLGQTRMTLQAYMGISLRMMAGLGHGLEDLALFALVLAGQDDDLIVLFNIHNLPYPLK